MELHSQFFMAEIKIVECSFFVIALLPFSDVVMELVGCVPNTGRQGIALKTGEVVEVDIEQLCHLNKLPVQPGF